MESSIVIACLDIEGLHRWDEAPDVCAYLRNTHRHTFKVKIGVRVKHEDRFVEIFELREYTSWAFYEVYPTTEQHGCRIDFGTDSCEAMCVKIHKKLTECCRYDIAFIEVFEEETGGARYEWQSNIFE